MAETKCFLCHDTNATIFGYDDKAAKNYEVMCHGRSGSVSNGCATDYTIPKEDAEKLVRYPETERDEIRDQAQEKMPAHGGKIFIKKVDKEFLVELIKNQEREPADFK